MGAKVKKCLTTTSHADVADKFKAPEMSRKKLSKNKTTAPNTISSNAPMKIDLNSSNSPLYHLQNLNSIINDKTFQLLTDKCKSELMQLLPPTDCFAISRQLGIEKASFIPPEYTTRNPGNSNDLLSALNNEFLSKACDDWLTQLRSGKHQNKLHPSDLVDNSGQTSNSSTCDTWKETHFELIWG